MRRPKKSGCEEPLATLHVGGTRRLNVTLPGLSYARLTLENAPHHVDPGPGVIGMGSREMRSQQAWQSECSFGFLSPGVYLLECRYTDPQGETATLEETVDLTAPREVHDVTFDF